MPITTIMTAEIRATSKRFKCESHERTTRPMQTIETKPIRPTKSEVCKKAIAISTGIKVPEVLMPIMTRKKTTIITPIGKSKMPLNKDCSSSGKDSIDKETTSLPWACSVITLSRPA